MSRMKKAKAILLSSPEYLLLLSVIFYWTSSTLLNPIAFILMALLILQIIFQNKTIGIIIPTLLIMICLYMLAALVSEFNEFPTFNSDAKKLLFVGLTFFLSTMVVSGIMIFKYALSPLKNHHISVS